MTRRKVNYLSNRNLLAEIHKSKISYCEYEDINDTVYDYITENIEDLNNIEVIEQAKKTRANRTGYDIENINTEDLVFRVHTYEHIPSKYNKIHKKADSGETYARLNFVPFKHYKIIDNELKEVLRSHCRKGKFSDSHGKITNELAKMFILLVERYSQRPNWRGYSYLDEMQGNALLQLSQFALQFNEAKSENPFAYFTSFLSNSFTRVLLIEQKHQSTRDTMLEDMGQTPSNTRQLENEEFINHQKNEHHAVSISDDPSDDLN